MTIPVLRADSNGVTTLTLNRPERHNALTVPMLELLDAQLANVTREQGIGVLVLRGEGPSFCSGADTAEFANRPSDPGRRRRIELVTSCLDRIRSLPVPTVAHVEGAALGAGWGLALACDLTYASDDATFCLPEVPHGYRLPEAIVHRLREVVGPVCAASIVLRGQPYTVSEAHAAGWVVGTGKAQEVRQQVEELAAALAAHGRQVLTPILTALRATPSMSAPAVADDAVDADAGGRRADAAAE